MLSHSSPSAIPEFSFDSGSMVRFQLRGGGSSRRTNIQLLLRTRSTSGTLLSVTSREASEYIVLEVSQSQTELRCHMFVFVAVLFSYIHLTFS